METVRLESLAPRGWPAVAVTIGNFDGVHRGHQELVRTAVAEARARHGTAVALTFDPHPQAVVGGGVPPRLTTDGQRARLLADLGVDRLAVLPFTSERAAQEPSAFVEEVLAGALGARVVVVGEGFRFGRHRRGDLALLKRMAPSLGFAVQGLAPTLHEGRPVSSTRIREALAAGAVDEARALLGRAYALEGVVVRGAGRGRVLDIPTANLRPENGALPEIGVYAGWARVPDGARLPAVINVGRRPTFGAGALTVEAHLLDFSGALYGQRLELELEARLRGEVTFSGAEALVAQIRRDIAAARGVLESY